MELENVLFEKKDRLAIITLNRPKKLNALSVALQEDIIKAVGLAEADEDVRVIIIKGAGRGFSAGYDIDPSAMEAYKNRTILSDLQGLKETSDRWMTLFDCQKPIIVQVHGVCLAGGTDMALLADVVIAAEDAQIGHPGVRGIGTPLTQMWVYLIGHMRAKMLLLTGDTISGKQAAEWGLVAMAVPPEELEEEVLRLANRMAAIPSDVLFANKSVVNKAVELMGLKEAAMAACELDSICHFGPTVQKFEEIVNTKGLKEALKWRDSGFSD